VTRKSIAFVAACWLAFMAMALLVPLPISIFVQRAGASWLYAHRQVALASVVWRYMAHNGDAMAASNLAVLQYRKFYLPGNYSKTGKYENFKATDAALLGPSKKSPDAQFNRAMIRVSGEFNSEWFVSARTHLKTAADMGHEVARLAVQSLEESSDEYALYRVLADSGDSFAALRFGDQFTRGENEADARNYLRIASEGGVRPAMSELGRLLVWSELLKSEWPSHYDPAKEGWPPEAKKWTYEAARLGDVSAMFDIASCYNYSIPFCSSRSSAEAADWYESVTKDEARMLPPWPRIAENGALQLNIQQFSAINPFVMQFYSPMKAHLALGKKYMSGDGVPMNLDKANALFAKLPATFPRQEDAMVQHFDAHEAELRLVAAEYFVEEYTQSEPSDAFLKKHLAFQNIRALSVLDVFLWKQKFPAQTMDALKAMRSAKRYVIAGDLSEEKMGIEASDIAFIVEPGAELPRQPGEIAPFISSKVPFLFLQNGDVMHLKDGRFVR
jgi:TPR repeat protein